MKRIDYLLPRVTSQITGTVFVTQAIVELITVRKPGFEWVLPVCGLAFAITCGWVLFAVLWNAYIKAAEENT